MADATFVERCIQQGPFEDEGQGGAIDLDLLQDAMTLWDDGTENTAWLKSILNCTTVQAAELDEILATQPGILANILLRSGWVESVVAKLTAGFKIWSGYGDADAVRGKLGLN